MVMCACAVTEDSKTFKVLDAPGSSVPGDRIVFDGFPGEPDKQLNPKKKVDMTNDFNNLSSVKADCEHRSILCLHVFIYIPGYPAGDLKAWYLSEQQLVPFFNKFKYQVPILGWPNGPPNV